VKNSANENVKCKKNFLIFLFDICNSILNEANMIQPRTILKVADNTGAKTIRCFKVLGGSKRRYAQIGDIIVASVQEAEPRRTVKKKDIVRAVVVRQKKPFRLKSGIYLRFDDNAAVILDGKTKNPKGTRILGPIPRCLKDKGFSRIVTMSKNIV